jgi:hypothetical protein
MFTRPHYCTLRAEHSAHRSMIRNKPNNSQNSIIRRLRRKMSVISIPIEIFRRISAQITPSYGQHIVHAVLSVETNPTPRKTRSFVDFVEEWPWLLSRLRYFDVYTPKLLHFATEHSARCIMRRNKASNSQNSIDRRFRRKMTVSSFPIEIFRRLHAQITAFCYRI